MSDDVLAVGMLKTAIARWEATNTGGSLAVFRSMESELVEAIDRARATLRPPVTDSLDAAWAEAEAALPEGWTLGGVQRSNQRGQTKRQAYISTAWGGILAGQTAVLATPRGRRIAYGDTPAAALRALAAKLREVGR